MLIDCSAENEHPRILAERDGLWVLIDEYVTLERRTSHAIFLEDQAEHPEHDVEVQSDAGYYQLLDDTFIQQEDPTRTYLQGIWEIEDVGWVEGEPPILYIRLCKRAGRWFIQLFRKDLTSGVELDLPNFRSRFYSPTPHTPIQEMVRTPSRTQWEHLGED